MSNAERVERRRLQRRKRRAIERQDLFTLDYIRDKYCDIYNEAARTYEQLNSKYPTKFDLRKTEEHKVWKMQNAARSIFSIQEPFHIPPDAEITVTYQPSCPELQPSTEPTSNPELQPSTEPTSNPELQPSTEPTSCPELQPSTEPTSNPELLPSTESTSNPELLPSTEPTSCPELLPSPEPPTSPDPPSSPEPPTSPDPPSSPEPPTSPELQPNPEPQRLHASNTKLPHGDNMQLRIPLLKAPAKRPSVTTETLQIITEEVLQEENTVQPLEEIDPEVFQKIINELRADPDLQNIFTDIEQQVEFQELGMDLDIPEDSNMLERELENWEFW